MGKLANIAPYKGGGITPELQKYLDILYDSLRGDITLSSGNVILNGITIASGCIPSNGTDATNDLDFSVGIQRNSSNTYTIRANSAFTKRADATWAAGTGNGGLAATLTWAANDWHLHLLGKSADPTAFDYIFDTSATCVNGLADDAVEAAGFDIYKRVGSLRTGGAAWPSFHAREVAIGKVRYLLKAVVFELTKDWAGADDTAQTGTLAAVPGGIQVDAILGVVFTDSSAAAVSALLVSSLDQTDTAANSALSTYVGTIRLTSTAGANSSASCVIPVSTSTSRTFRYRGADTTVDHNASFCTHGWEDTRL